RFLGRYVCEMAFYLNVGTAAPLLRRLSLSQIVCAAVIVLAVNVVNFFLGGAIGRIAGLQQDHQVTCEYSSGMRSNGTALGVGLASFPRAPPVTVPGALHIVLSTRLGSIVKSRLAARFGDVDSLQAAATGSSDERVPKGPRLHPTATKTGASGTPRLHPTAPKTGASGTPRFESESLGPRQETKTIAIPR